MIRFFAFDWAFVWPHLCNAVWWEAINVLVNVYISEWQIIVATASLLFFTYSGALWMAWFHQVLPHCSIALNPISKFAHSVRFEDMRFVLLSHVWCLYFRSFWWFLLLSHLWCLYFRSFWVNKSSMRKIIYSTVFPRNQDEIIHTWCTTFTLYSLFLHLKEEYRQIQTKLIMKARWTAASTSIQTYCWCFTFIIQSIKSVRF